MKNLKHLKTYEEFSQKESNELDEGVKDFIKKSLEKGSTLAKEVWAGAKRESRETQEAIRLIGELVKGNEITDMQKKFVAAQSVDLVKILPLIAIQGIPIPIPITPFLILLGKKVGFDILPSSHTKVDYNF
jgi:hypothetical protein